MYQPRLEYNVFRRKAKYARGKSFAMKCQKKKSKNAMLLHIACYFPNPFK